MSEKAMVLIRWSSTALLALLPELPQAHTSDQDMQALRHSIDATPVAASALKAKGLSSAQVVAINIADGVLTMFTRTA